MTDEMLFSVLGIKLANTGLTEVEDPTTSISPLSCDYETPCRTPFSDNSSELIENLSSPSECYTDLSYSSLDTSWTDWASTSIPSSSDYLGDLGELDYDLDWCLDKNLNFGLPERTPMCTQGCERFLNLPLPSIEPPHYQQQQQQYEHQQQHQQFFQHDEPLLVLGIDLGSFENNFTNDFNNNQIENNVMLSTSANAALATHDYTSRNLEQPTDDRCFPCTYQGCLKVEYQIFNQ